jgi:outer membrane receptor protein involved in Fe transport
MKPPMVLLYAVADRRAQRAPKPTRIMKKNYRLTESPLQRVSAQLALAILAASTAWSQAVNEPPPPTGDSAASVPTVDRMETEGGIIELSPFEVEATNNGYLANSAMSGTRLNSRLEDLAASISVVTKQQLEDTAAFDINDVFKYEASTEGIYQYTSFNVDRGVVTDSVMSNPSGSTRMRGLSAANVAVNGMDSSLPIDTFNIESIEISRGPNSSIFGLGNSGGGVNINTKKASTAKDISQVSTSVDSYDGYRLGLDFNRVLLRGKLGVRALGLYDEKGFVRKPSSDTTRRAQIAVTAQPFRNTTIRGGFESYRNFNSRPNSVTPRDMYTDWAANGKPTWNPITQTVNFGDGRPSITGVTTALESTLLPYSIGATDSALTTFPSQYIDNGVVGLYMINRMPNGTSTGPNNTAGTGRLLQNTNFYTKNSGQYPLFLAPGISDKSLYDWESDSLTAPNYVSARGEVFSAEIEQFFIRTSRQVLAFQGTFVSERTSSKSRSFLGSGSNLQVFIDINEKLLDGSDNPYFLRPYVGGSQPIFTRRRNNSDNYRGTLAYQLDLSQEDGWLKWIGRHNFTGYGEYKEVYGGSLGYKDTISSTEAWMGTVTSRNSASFRTYPHFYVGDVQGGNVDYSPERLKVENGGQVLRYYNGVTGQWINEPVEFDEYYYANRLNRRLLSTSGANWQGFFWKDRVILNYGIRRDINRTREGNSAGNPSAATNGYYNMSPLYLFTTNDWVQRRGQTTNQGVVVKPLDWLHLHYSESDSFSPSSLAYDIYGKPLGDPRGQTKDYGFSLSLLRDQGGSPRLYIKAVQYETLDLGRGSSELNTIVQRAIRLDADGNSGGGDPDLESFYSNAILAANPTWTPEQIEAEAERLMGVSPSFIDSHRNRTHGDGANSASRGKEVEISFNPNRYWTMKANIVQQKAFNGAISPDLQQYVADRLPVWQAAVNPYNPSQQFWNGSYVVGGRTPESWYTVNLLAPMKLAVATQGKMRNQVREWRANFLTNYRLAGISENRWLRNMEVGGAVRWEDKAIIGYLGGQPESDGAIRELDPNKPVYDKARYYVDFMAKYRMRLFNDKVPMTLQFNVSNAFESGRLQAVAVNPDGTPYIYRIIDPRMFRLSATFDF